MRNQRGFKPIHFLLDALAFVVILVIATVAVRCTKVEASSNVPSMQSYALAMELKYDLPSGLLRAVCEQESNWQNVAGSHGEIGVCQMKPDTVRHICPPCYRNATRVYFQTGSRNAYVAVIQAKLSYLGYYTGHVDGTYGPLTRDAVLRMQKGAGVTADGVVGPTSWALLFHDEPYPGMTIEAVLWNPYANIEWAARYLVWLREKVSPEPLVMIAAYNGGGGNPVVKYMVGVSARLEHAQGGGM